MTALGELLSALRDGNATGDDATLCAAWNAETDPSLLLDVVCLCGDAATRDAAFTAFLRDERPEHVCCVTDDDVPCPACCDAIRSAVRCPTWAELTGGER